MYYEHGGLVSFGVAAAEVMTGHRIPASAFDEDGKAWIDFRGPPETFRNVSFSRVLRGKVPASVFRGKTVVIGATSPSLQDLHATSTTGDALMSRSRSAGQRDLDRRPRLTALLLGNRARPDPDPAVRRRARRGDALAEAAARARGRRRCSASLYAVATQLAFDRGAVLPVVYPLLALVVSALGALAVNYLITSFERQRVHDTFARFVPEAVVADVLDRVDEGDLRFGGVRRECTVLFSDLRGFTSFAEELEPERVIEVLNHYLER